MIPYLDPISSEEDREWWRDWLAKFNRWSRRAHLMRRGKLAYTPRRRK